LDYGTKPIGMVDEEWVLLERKERRLVMLYLDDLILFNVSKEKTPHLSKISWGICVKLNTWLINSFYVKSYFPLEWVMVIL